MTREQILQGLRALAAGDPDTKEELALLEAESSVFCEHIVKSPVFNEMPHFVMHFLHDADIRLKP